MLSKELEQLVEKLSIIEPKDASQLDAELSKHLESASYEECTAIAQAIADAIYRNYRISPPPSVDDIDQADGSGHASSPDWYDNQGGHDHYGEAYSTRPRFIGVPGSIDDIKHLLANVREGGQVDVVATGKSPNMVFAEKSQYLLDLRCLNKRLDFEPGLYKKDPKAAKYYRTEAGVTITDMLDAIDKQKLALRWAGYTPQSAIGAIATSSAKSGFLPPIVDFVLSYDVILNGGKSCRIEPTDGITDPVAFQNEHQGSVELIQDDETFYGSLVLPSGVTTSFIIQASDRYCLAFEKNFHWDIDDAQPEIEHILKLQCKDRSAEEHPADWQLDIWVTARSRQTLLVRHHIIPYKEIERKEPGSIWDLLTSLAWRIAWLTPVTTDTIINRFLHTQAQGRTELDWREFLGNSVPKVGIMFATKFAIPYAGDENNFDGGFLALLDEYHRAVHDNRIYVTSPITFRFAGPSRHQMALSHWPEKGRRVVAIEHPFIPHGVHSSKIVRRLDLLRRRYDGRWHFGLSNLLEEDPTDIIRTYGADLDRARAVRTRLLGGKSSPFALHRNLRQDPVGFIDPDRYYFIRFEYLGFEFVSDASGYVGITGSPQDEGHAQAGPRFTGKAAVRQMWRFMPQAGKPNRYQIVSAEANTRRWTVDWIGGFVRQNANKVRSGDGENVFTVAPAPDTPGAWQIIRENGEAMIVTLHPSIMHFIVSWGRDKPGDHVMWLEDAGPAR